MSAHTPGPWHVDSFGGTSVRSRDGELAQMSDWLPQYHEERDANARLIAAAPCLLEALQSMVREFGYSRAHASTLVHDEHMAIQGAMQAIEKATGGKQ